MTDTIEPLDLAPIRARAEAAREHMGYIGYRSVFAPVVEVDIPALLAEVDRLRSLLGEEEWVWGSESEDTIDTAGNRAQAEAWIAKDTLEGRDSWLVRRRPAGPWSVVPHE